MTEPSSGDLRPVASKGPAAGRVGFEGRAGGRAPLRPIGPERLASLREAIRAGHYPRARDVVQGLLAVFQTRRPSGPSSN